MFGVCASVLALASRSSVLLPGLAPRGRWTFRIDFSMTDPSLFKQVARHIVQRGQLPDDQGPAIGQAARTSSSRPPGRSDERQMGDLRSGAQGVRQAQASDRNWPA